MPARDASSSWLRRARSAAALLRVRELAFTLRRCPFCGITIVLRLRRDELGIRCLRCGASAVHLSLGWTLRRHVPRLHDRDACELSARGPLSRYLRAQARSAALSEYRADLAPGSVRDDVRCEDVQHLTYADASFDLVTHTEVMEHVPDDLRAFTELHRVLRPGGIMLFTVPLRVTEKTLERAMLRNGAVVTLIAPMYHTDPLRGGSGILVFRDYGGDIVARLLAAGFDRAWIQTPPAGAVPWGYGRAVVCAVRA
ncbi:MAG: class I SAM-dependent methyltransferase [Rudaea sp.]|nr:class I SAM-dependent methyltransferase [Rudaea sp.]